MIEGKYKAYSEYKNSGVEWLEEVPEHWKVTKLRYYLNGIKDGTHGTHKTVDNGEVLLSGKNIKNGSLVISENERQISLEEHNSIIANGFPQKGDLLISVVGTIGQSCVYKLENPLSFQRSVCFLRPSNKLDVHFLNYIFSSLSTQQQLKNLTSQATVGGVYMGDIVEVLLSLPPITEQQKTTHFLDHETAKIDTLIEKQKQLIKLLKEKRQAVISHAVTKGLNPDAPMRDSGVEWLGEVPEHWEIKRLKNTSEIVDCHNKTPEYFEEGEYFVIRTTNVKQQQLKFNGALYTNETNFKKWTRRGIPPAGSILFTREAPAGEVCIVPENLKFCMGQRMMNFICFDFDYTCYLFDFLISDCLDRYIESVSHGSTVSHLRVEQVENIPVLVPRNNEILAIHTKLNEIKTRYDNLIEKAVQAIELMQERRTAIISAAVTGKIDVRDWKKPGDIV